MFSSFTFADAVKNPLSKIKTSLKQMMKKQQVEFTPIIPQKIFHISTPNDKNIESLLAEFKSANQFQLWNISQYPYPQNILSQILENRERNADGRQIVYNLTYQYFANIPFCEMVKAIQNIENFCSLNAKNKVYIHCQENKRRSAIFLASYIFLTGQETDIVSAILKVNRLLNISMQDNEVTEGSTGSIYKSQHLVLKNLMNYINNSSFINRHAWNLKKILINNAPKIHSVLKFLHSQLKVIKFKVLLEIRSVEGISYKKIFHDQFIEGESLCLRIPSNETVVLKDDFVVIIKYVHDKKGYSILRAQLNTNFIYDQYFRVQRNDMDLSVNNAHVKNETVFMDLLLQSNIDEQSQLSKLNILKDSSQKQLSQPSKSMKQEKTSKYSGGIQPQMLKQQKKQDEEQGFGILDEQQEAAHNQKIEKQIEQQLAKELQNIRKKKTNSQTQKDTALLNENINSLNQSTQHSPTKQPIPPVQSDVHSSEQGSEEGHSEEEQEQHEQEESDQEESDESDEQSEEDGLDDYLSKLQKEAENKIDH